MSWAKLPGVRVSWWVISDRAGSVWSGSAGEHARRGPEGSEGMPEVMCEEDEDRLSLAP